MKEEEEEEVWRWSLDSNSFLLMVVVLDNKGVEVVLYNAKSCCSRNRRVTEDKGEVHSPHPEESADDEPIRSVAEAIGKANQTGGE